jgi:hypothetical protein
MPRKMIWIESERFGGWGCSDCAWVFNLPGQPSGGSLEEMLQKYEGQRDKDFGAHRCAKHPRSKSPQAK